MADVISNEPVVNEGDYLDEDALFFDSDSERSDEECLNYSQSLRNGDSSLHSRRNVSLFFGRGFFFQ